MAIELPDGTVSRTLPEQVGENTRRLGVLEDYQLESFYREGDKLYAKRVSGDVVDLGEVSGVANVALTSGSLIFTLTDGTTINAGLVKGISSMSIDGSQHLIVAYNNGTTEDLGAIFSGNVNIAGNLTADSIIENMTDYVFYKRSTDASYTYDYKYAGVVKNGNKLTFAIFLAFTPAASINLGTLIPLGYFSIPSSVGAKLYPYTQGSLSNALECKKVYATSGTVTGTDVICLTVKDTGTQIRMQATPSSTMTAETTYLLRYEVTFLLSDNLSA